MNCHKILIGSFSPYVLGLVAEANGDGLILPDYRTSEIGIMMNLIYSGT